MKCIVIKKKCDDLYCTEGEMVFTGTSSNSYNNKSVYNHQCKQCGRMGYYNKEYPYSYTEYEEHEKEIRWIE